jgi:DNA helicase-2/ATP-dependent DNA helicase PcrA
MQSKHGIKGAEFDNVFVILDNGRWNQYNFKYLFEGTTEKKSVIERTQKMFYVILEDGVDFDCAIGGGVENDFGIVG